MGLGRSGLVSGQFLLRHTALDHIGNRLPRLPVEHENVAGFGCLDQRWDASALTVRDVIQGRLGRDIVVPDVMVHGLVSPTLTPSLVVESHNRRSIAIRSIRTMATPKVGC